MVSCIAFAQEDKKGCKDHPMFTRMKEYYISDCKQKDFDAYEFIDPVTKKKVSIEGRYIFIEYDIKKEFRGQKSSLEVARNYTNAAQRIGGLFFMEYPRGDGSTYIKIKKR